MPQVIPYIAYYAATYFGASAVVAGAVAIGASLAVNAYQSRQQRRKARDAYNASLQDRLVMQSSTSGVLSRCYGRVRNVDGILFKGSHGSNKEKYTMVVALAGHECDAIEDVYLGDERLPLGPPDVNGWQSPTTGGYVKGSLNSEVQLGTVGGGSHTFTTSNDPAAGSIAVTLTQGSGDSESTTQLSYTQGGTGGRDITFDGGLLGGAARVLYQHVGAAPKVRVRKFLGAPGQDLSPYLTPDFPGLVTSADKFQGICCLLIEFTFDTDVFPNGLVPVSAVIRGAKVYDPRTSLTQWTQNPSLIANDWALYDHGGGAAAAEINTNSVISAANGCDVTHAFTLPSGPQVLPMFSCNIVCKLDANPWETLGSIVESMAGKYGWSGGLLTVRAGVYNAPVARTIDESWLRGAEPSAGEEGSAITSEQASLRVTTGPSRQDIINVMRPTISDAAQDYIATPVPEVRAGAWVTADGDEYAREVELLGVTDTAHAQHVCGVLMREQRNGLTITLPCNLRAYELELFDVVPVTLPRLGFVSKMFEVVGWRKSVGGITLTLKETAASIYDPDTSFSETDLTPNTALPSPFNVPVPSSITLASGTAQLLKQADGTITSRIEVNWAATTSEAVAQGVVQVVYGDVTTPMDEWRSVEVPGGSTRAFLTDVQDGAYYVIKLRARNAMGVNSLWSVQQLVYVEGKTQVPSNVAGLAATIVQGGVQITRTTPPDVDYEQTVYRLGTSWASYTVEFRAGKASPYLIPWLALGSYTLWAKHEDTTGNESATAVSTAFVVDAAAQIQWTSVNGRPKQYRVVARGSSDTSSPVLAGFYNGESGALLHGGTRSYSVVVINRSTGVEVSFNTYDVYGTGGAPAAMASALDALSSDKMVVVYSYDEPQTNRLSAALLAAMKRCGASSAVYGSPQLKFRSAYILVGIPGCGEGGGFEAYNGDVDNSTNAWCDVSFLLTAQGQLVISGTAATPRTLADYSYTGDLDATRNKVWRQTSDPGGAAANGDFWFDTDDGNKQYLRAGGVWVSVRDDGISAALAAAASAQSTADGKIDSYYQTSAPAGGSEGDLWFDTDDGNKCYIRTGGSWVVAADTRIASAISSAATAQATADGKITTFYATSAPTATAVGDLWYDTDDAYARLYRWNGSSWLVVSTNGAVFGVNISGQAATSDIAANAATVAVQQVTTGSTSVGSSGGDVTESVNTYAFTNSSAEARVVQWEALIDGLSSWNVTFPTIQESWSDWSTSGGASGTDSLVWRWQSQTGDPADVGLTNGAALNFISLPAGQTLTVVIKNHLQHTHHAAISYTSRIRVTEIRR